MSWKIQLLIISILALPALSLASADSKFFANESVQRLHPEAFVLQPEAEDFLRALPHDTDILKNALVDAIKKDAVLFKAIQNWPTLSFDEQVPYLKQIFALEVKLMNITAPELVIDGKEIPGQAAFFDFDLQNPGAGRVLLNPEVLKGMDKYDSLALLIHETRHSAQFQMAFDSTNTTNAAKAYHAAFHAQKTDIRSFCDFLTLANEFEAFQFGNYVLGKLTDWKLDMPDMGTFASQYDSLGTLKLDLTQLLDNEDPKSLIEKFNEAESEQCKLLGACR